MSMSFIESIYAAVTIFAAFTLPLLLTIMQRLFKYRRLHRSTYRTLILAALSLSLSLFFDQLQLFYRPDLMLFLSKMVEINFVSFILYAFMLELSVGR